MSLYNCYHLRSDALLATLIQLGFSAEQIGIDFNGDFRKKYTSGLESIEFDNQFAHLVLNENSIYDQLPEGLFHQSRGNAQNQSATSYIEEHKRYKSEAKAARKFFNPLDHVLLMAKADARLKKESVLQDLLQDETTFLAKLWRLEKYSNNRYLASFLPLLQISEKYKAQLPAIAALVGEILNCKVQYKKRYALQIDHTNVEEELLLGFNTCLEADDNESALQWCFVFSDIEMDVIVDFFDNGDVMQILNLIEQFFIPIDVLVQYEFEVPELQEIGNAILGVTTI